MKEDNPCFSCGLCCLYYPTINNEKGNPAKNEWAGIKESEAQVPKKLYQIIRQPKIEFYIDEKITKFIKSKADPYEKDKRRCISLEGEQYKNIKCGIYEDRPNVCRDFPVGGWQCNKIRKWGGLEELTESKVNLVSIDDYYESEEKEV